MLTRLRVLPSAAALFFAAGCGQDNVSGPKHEGPAPCTSSGTLAIGGTANGNLSNATCWFSFDSTRIQHYSFTLTQTTPVAFTMTAASGSFDPFLWLYRNTYGDTAGIVAFNDNADGSSNSTLRAVLVPGTYVVAANHIDPKVFGAYTLSAAAWNGKLENCEEAFVMIGTTTEQALSSTDCPRLTGSGFEDAVAVYAGPGQAVNVTVTSGAFPAQLELDDLAFNIVDTDDNATRGSTTHVSAGGVPGGAIYVLFVNSADATMGSYTLSVSPASAVSAQGAPARATTTGRLGDRRIPKGFRRAKSGR
ncbi:MAG: hypothetical protein HOQ11_07775 [Gemmatimonadaceae bacterium]|nr:hypothetical protein [Gemmatimonadaceae bacterium]NUQ94799.1 hypothetical protein [Gemmatimonadaceae bacterium]NUR20902.1 hypothetical protein [Gemmatimonadaceae bacterium]NUS97290.1 hypothetical protein [Gemmatimonadaceae bacterium]